MKKLFFALAVLVATNVAFADVSEREMTTLKEMTMSRLNETRPMIEGQGYCDGGEEGEVNCTWYIEDTGRTPDTMHGTFILKNGEYTITDAYEEYGC